MAAIFKRRLKTWKSVKAAGVPFLLVCLHLAGINLFGGKLAQCSAVFEIRFGFVGVRIDCQRQQWDTIAAGGLDLDILLGINPCCRRDLLDALCSGLFWSCFP